MILMILGLAVWGSTLATFLIKTYRGNMEKNKNALDFVHFKPQRMGRLTWECGVWKVPKQNAWAKHKSKQNALCLQAGRPDRQARQAGQAGSQNAWGV